MNKLPLNATIISNVKDGHPESKIIGIDNYTMETISGDILKWHSYTLIPSKEEDTTGSYERWYVVDFPSMGRSFVKLCDEADLPHNLDIDETVSGAVTIISEGDAELGTGKGQVFVYKSSKTNTTTCFAKEVFADGSTLYFEMCPFQDNISVTEPNMRSTTVQKPKTP